MITALLIILIFGLLVFVHELGHFIFAKRAGIKVEEFGFGFPPRLFKVKKGDTIYSINAIPLGGFVKIFGEQGEGEGQPDSFASRSLFTRSKIVIAGVVMNILLAFVILSFVFHFGASVAVTPENQFKVTDRAVSIAQVQSSTPASESGLRLGDKIIRVEADGSTYTVQSIEQFQKLVKDFSGKSTSVVIKRGKEIINIKVIPRINHPEDQGPLGIILLETGLIKYSWFGSIFQAAKTTASLFYRVLNALLKIIGGLIFQFQAPPSGQVTGPVGIAIFVGWAWDLGIMFLLNLTAMISINLAVLNILPLPALDGGRLFFFLIEAIRGGKKIDYKKENLIHAAGFAILIALAILVTIRDIKTYF